MPLYDYSQSLLALIFILALIGLLAWAARRFGFAGAVPPRGTRRRLALVEVLPVDAKRRLVLLRRDDVEHLVLLGTGTGADLLVEGGIPAASPAAGGAGPGEAPAPAPAPSPCGQGAR